MSSVSFKPNSLTAPTAQQPGTSNTESWATVNLHQGKYVHQKPINKKQWPRDTLKTHAAQGAKDVRRILNLSTSGLLKPC